MDKNPTITSIYILSVDDVQIYALGKTGRELTDDELRIVKKGIDSALGFGIDTILDAAVDEAVGNF